MAKFEIKKSDSGKYYYHLKASGNHEIILAKNNYLSAEDCLNAVLSVKNHASNDTYYHQLNSSDGQFYFHLKDHAGNILGRSEMYTTKAARDHGMSVVKAQAPDAPVHN